MPIQPIDFPMLSFEQANPLIAGLNAGQQFGQRQQMFPEELRKAQLANAIAAVQARYAAPKAAMDLSRTQAEIPYINAQTGKMNKDIQWYDRNAQSEIGLRGAQAGLAGSEAAKNKFLIKYRRPKIPYPRRKRTGYYGNFSLRDRPAFIKLKTSVVFKLSTKGTAWQATGN